MLVFVELLRTRRAWRESLRVTRNVAITAVVISTTSAFFSGYQASSSLGDLSAEIQGAVGEHHAYGRLLLFNALLLGTFAWLESRATHGKGFMFSLYILTLLVQVGLTVVVGSLGGGLVFIHRLGVAVPT
jgi:hypothetical protein